tara:strand:+ start:4298 stop:7240 length:2943 start_codon:yes stop_codon:yes gene_type:complete
MTSAYWPTIDNIEQCIRTEAEQLNDSVLLAVHESMILKKKMDDKPDQFVKEYDFLKQLIEGEKCYPVIGASGVGKSHFVRWLEIQLQKDKNAKNFHVVRIPKNQSLRDVLNRLLLNDPEFDDERKKIEEVRELQTVKNVKEHLLTEMSLQLQGEKYQERREEEKEGDYKKRMSYASENNLPALISDVNFKDALIGEGKVLEHVAKRLVGGATNEEIEDDSFQFQADIFDFSRDDDILGDLSAKARSFIVNKRLNTADKERDFLADMLNDVVVLAQEGFFSQNFTFNRGSFEDVFKAIRRKLKNSGKTLFILVEDMAAISAVREPLIDALINLEDIEEKDLCPLHSVVAATADFIGYKTKRDSIITRANGEWFVEKKSEEDLVFRLCNFYGRYLNAARWGLDALEKKFNQLDPDYPPIWSDQSDYDKNIKAFGKSNCGHSLFPFNQTAIEALVDENCKSGEFLPRKMLHKLLEILKKRYQYERREFPKDREITIDVSADIIRETSDLEKSDRVRAFLSFWGYGAWVQGDLVRDLKHEIAVEFNLEQVVPYLQDGVPTPRKKQKEKKPERVTEKPEQQKVKNSIQSDIHQYFQEKKIPQEEANTIRKKLYEEVKNSKSIEFYGVKVAPELNPGTLYLIDIPFTNNNPKHTKVNFGSETEFEDEIKSAEFKKIIEFILDEEKKWSFDEVDDYATYKNFLNQWVSDVIKKLIDNEREVRKQKGKIKAHLQLASIFKRPLKPDKVLDYISCSAEKLLEDINYSDKRWHDMIMKYKDKWDDVQSEWLDWYSTNDHALEGDLIEEEIDLSLEQIEIPRDVRKLENELKKELKGRFQAIFLLQGNENKISFDKHLTKMGVLINDMQANAQYNVNVSEKLPGKKKFINHIEKIKKDPKSWDYCDGLLRLLIPSDDQSIENISNVHDTELEEINEIFQWWQGLYDTNFLRMKDANKESGAEKAAEKKEKVSELIVKIKTDIEKISDGLEI